MRKFIFALILLTTSQAQGATDIIRPEHYAFFEDAIRIKGFSCESSDGGHVMGEAYVGGKIFKVYCNDNALVYRVITGGKILCVEPWDTKQQQCQ